MDLSQLDDEALDKLYSEVYAERRRRKLAKVDGMPEPSAAVMQLLRDRRRIAAIKQYREDNRPACDLLLAKAVIDSLAPPFPPY